jgi:tyrosinase
MQRWTSEPLPVPRHPGAPYARADLEFEDVAHDGPSFLVLLYFNNPDIHEDAGYDAEQGYAGHFTVFAHGECWGDPGHCDVPAGPIHAFDRRPLHPLTPVNFTVEVTASLRALGDANEVTVTALAFPSRPEHEGDLLRFERLTLVTYD